MRKEEEPIPLSQEVKDPPLPEVRGQDENRRDFRHEGER